MLTIYSVSANKTKRIYVIGAGASGIATATRLIENGFEDVTILEAEYRIGGSIRTLKYENVVMDLGANM